MSENKLAEALNAVLTECFDADTSEAALERGERAIRAARQTLDDHIAEAKARTPAGWLLGAAYVATGGRVCPKCGGKHVSTRGDDALVRGSTDLIVLGPMACRDCGAEWDEVYRLAGYDPKAGAA